MVIYIPSRNAVREGGTQSISVVLYSWMDCLFSVYGMFLGQCDLRVKCNSASLNFNGFGLFIWFCSWGLYYQLLVLFGFHNIALVTGLWIFHETPCFPVWITVSIPPVYLGDNVKDIEKMVKLGASVNDKIEYRVHVAYVWSKQIYPYNSRDSFGPFSYRCPYRYSYTNNFIGSTIERMAYNPVPLVQYMIKHRIWPEEQVITACLNRHVKWDRINQVIDQVTGFDLLKKMVQHGGDAQTMGRFINELFFPELGRGFYGSRHEKRKLFGRISLQQCRILMAVNGLIWFPPVEVMEDFIAMIGPYYRGSLQQQIYVTAMLKNGLDVELFKKHCFRFSVPDVKMDVSGSITAQICLYNSQFMPYEEYEMRCDGLVWRWEVVLGVWLVWYNRAEVVDSLARGLTRLSNSAIRHVVSFI